MCFGGLGWHGEKIIYTDVNEDPQTGSKGHSLHAVDLSQWYGKPCAYGVYPSRPQQCGPDYRFLGKPAMRTR